MKEKILIVEDEFVEADYLSLMLTKAGYLISGIARSVVQAQENINKERPDFVLLDIFLRGKQTGIDLAHELSKKRIPFIYLSANSNETVLNMAKATEPYGFLVKPFREKDLLIMLEIARYRYEHSIDRRLRNEIVLEEKLATVISASQNADKKILEICRILQTQLAFDYITTGFNFILDAPSLAVSYLRIGFDEYQKIGVPELLTIAGLKSRELEEQVNRGSLYKLLADTFKMKSCTSFPLQISHRHTFTFSLYSRHAGVYDGDHTGLLNQLQTTISPLLESIFIKHNEIPTGASHPLPVVRRLEGTRQEFPGIIGTSPILLNVLDMIMQVAPSETSVLILGESGTGKERIAECIHHLSARKKKLLVKVNCATLPPTLIESELFGHEKGSFTGAVEKRIGKFEKADQGTIFLDEIGEMPPELQVKLLRVLQEKYIERIGASDITPVDVRIIAATNRNLEKEVAEGRFRLDLYYRLNVFPVELPALRKRTDDIPALSKHFIQYYNSKAGKKITGLSNKVVERMKAYHWPGNIRELENVIERGVLLAKGTIIEDITLSSVLPKAITEVMDTQPLKTIDENERDHIISVLKKCDGKVWGTGGAAELLNVPSSTLRSKMKKLGITRLDIL